MNLRHDYVPALCGRTTDHPEHLWDTRPASKNDLYCDGTASTKDALQLLIDQPALLEVRGPGVVIAEGVRAS